MTHRWRINRGITHNKWKRCPRCGLDWPERALKREQETGAVVCPECFDEPSHAYIKSQGELADTGGRQSAPWEPD